MRVFSLIVVFFCFFNSASASLTPNFEQTYFSPSFGVMFTNFNVSGSGASFNSSSETGFTVGVQAYIPTDSLYLDYITGVYYWNASNRLESDRIVGGDLVNTNSLIEMQRVSVPLIAKIYPFEKGSILYAKAGFFNHFLLSANADSTVTNRTSNNVEQVSTNLKQDPGYNSYVLDAVLGVGIEAQLGESFAFFIELNYLYGLTPIVSSDSIEINSDTFFTSFGIGF